MGNESGNDKSQSAAAIRLDFFMSGTQASVASQCCSEDALSRSSLLLLLGRA